MSFRPKPAADSASKIQSSIGRPSTSTSVFGTSFVRCSRRLPRPVPITIVFTPSFLLPELREDAEVLQGGDVAVRRASRGDVLQQSTHDLAAARLRQALGEAH